MKKLTAVVVLFLAAFLATGNSALAQCYPGRIGGCPTNNIGVLMAGNLAMVNGYGYGGYYGDYGYGGRTNGYGLAVVGINAAARVLGGVLIAREQTKQVQAITRAQYDAQMAQQQAVVYIQPQQIVSAPRYPLQGGDGTQPQTYGLSNIRPLDSGVVPMPLGQSEPMFAVYNRSGFRSKLVFANGAVIYLERGRSVKLAQAEIEAVKEAFVFMAVENGVREVGTTLQPTENFNDLNIVAPEPGL